MAKRGKKRWIQRATSRMKRKGTAGSFRKWCKARGHDGATAACIAAGLKSRNPKIRRKAQFAKAVRGRKR